MSVHEKKWYYWITKHKALSIVLSFIIVVCIISVANAANQPATKNGSNKKPATSNSTNSTTSSPNIATTSPPVSTPSPASAPTTPSCFTASQAANEEGQSGCVQFTGYAYTSDSGQMYLDQSTSAPYGFSAWIPAGSSFEPSTLNQYSGQSIDVTGSIVNYNGEPEIEVTSASQIQLAQ